MIYQEISGRLPVNQASSQLASWLGQIVFTGLTLLLFYPAFIWMFNAFVSQEHRFQLLGVMLLIAFLIYKYINNRSTIRWQFILQPRTIPVFMYIFSITTFVINEYYLDIHILSASLSVLGLYALYGLFTSRFVWQKGLIPTLLLIVLLPFGDYLNIYLGFPLRLFSAYVSADTLSALGYPSMSSETIIVLENQYSNVDLNCSGIKGTWSGLAFFVLLSWLENKAIGLAWFWRLAIFVLALIGANILRITILVLLGSHFTYFEFADLIHEMLGIIGFTLACLIGWGLLLTQKSNPNSERVQEQLDKSVKKSQLALVLLILTIVTMNLFYTPMPKTNAVTVSTSLDLPDNWSPQLVDLTYQENEFFNRNQARANKYSLLLDNNLNASLIAVHSTYWKGQHDPKNCLLAQGYNITHDTTLRLSSTQSVRYLDLDSQGKKYMAIYWFQNSKLITDDYSKRIYAGLLDKNNPWVLSSVLIEKSEYNNLNIRDIIDPIQKTIHKKIIQATHNEPKNQNYTR